MVRNMFLLQQALKPRTVKNPETQRKLYDHPCL